MPPFDFMFHYIIISVGIHIFSDSSVIPFYMLQRILLSLTQSTANWYLCYHVVTIQRRRLHKKKEKKKIRKKEKKTNLLHLLQSKKVLFFQVTDNGLELSEMLGHLVSFFFQCQILSKRVSVE